MAMLLCLDPNYRSAYLLGYIYEFSHDEAADILEISKDNFRQRLSRSRKAVEEFTAKSCGLVSDKAFCSCPRRLPAAVSAGRISQPVFYSGGDTVSYESVREEAMMLAEELRTVKLQKSVRSFDSPRDFGQTVLNLVNNYGRSV